MALIWLLSIVFALLTALGTTSAVNLNPVLRVNANCRNRDFPVRNNIRLRVRYVWNDMQTDLDTSTRFLGENVGFACSGSAQTYLSFEGDNTGRGEEEVAIVEVGDARKDEAWRGTTCIVLKAQWFNSRNQGNIRVIVEIRNKGTNNLIRDPLEIVARPGVGDSCSMRLIATVVVDEDEGIYLARAFNCPN
eukprot:GFKZ01006350.1.p1 GENE.GFKZ01006350.1~~GFKZ01006350.1.p1  ORF type:complete len:191 (-),score=13.52 GFKZ01006350.1:938-1510(-)